ncbi:MAG: hypothetical protein M1548_00130 [Actinobacteria bacterium]|nr:hypothetical protein [Actinomycetota bacterium]
MRVFIFTSGAPGEDSAKTGPFWKEFDDRYADKFIRHLTDNPDVCTGCGKACNHCRAGYKLDYADRIAGTHVHPDKLLAFVDDPYKYLPKVVRSHDVTLAINIHQDLLLEIPELAARAGSKALIVPVEDPDWLDRWLREELADICKEKGLEFAAPKPFCSLDEGEGKIIDEFIEEFRMGKPKLELKIKDGIVRSARVLRSAPCGDTYFVAHNIVGVPVGEELMHRAAKYWHSYPCIASMKMDPEFQDTILHRAGHILYEVVDRAVRAAGKGS